MSQSQSSGKSSHPSSPHGDDVARPSEGSTETREALPEAPVRLDQPTVISRRPPLPVAGGSGAGGPISRELSKELVGQRLEHFDVTEYVGGGGMGAVFRGIDTRLGRIVALKILAGESPPDEATIRRFQNEAQSGARCDHENIARVYHVGQDRGLHFIAFEYIEGKNVRDLVIEKGPLPLADAISYTLQVAEALVHASAHDVVHRDIKPSNILITEHRRAKLVDLGLARLHEVESRSEDLTASGVTLGTWDYISPEQARDPRAADVRSDIYSLGCTLYFMLTARPPFPEGTVLQKLLQHQGDAPPDPREFRPSLPAELSNILGKMMGKDPRRRYQGASELVGDLLILAGELGMRLPASPGMVWVQSGERRATFAERHLPWIVPVASLILIVAALHFMSVSQERSPPQMSAEAPRAAMPGDLPANPSAPLDNEDDTESRKNPERVDPDAPGTREPESDSPLAGERTGHITEPTERNAPALRTTRDDPPTSPGRQATGAQPSDPTTNVSEAPSMAAQLGPPEFEAEGSVVLDRSRSAGAVLVPPLGEAIAEIALPEEPPESRSNPPNGESLLDSNRIAERPLDDTPSLAGGIVIVRDAEQTSEFQSLRTACMAAQDGDVIELRFSGARVERPIELDNIRLTIRAGEQFQPLIVFQPAQSDPVIYPRSMITLTGGRLSLVNVGLELDLPRDFPAERWALIEVKQADELRLDRCWLTVQNASDRLEAYHEQVSVLEIRGPPGGDTMIMSDESGEVRSVAVHLQDCVVRGEATIARCRDLQAASISVQNGMLATTEHLLVVEGYQIAPRHSGRIEVDLRHVTAECNGGLALVSTSVDAPYQLPVELKCADSILLVESGAPLIEQVGADRAAALRSRLNPDFEKVFADRTTVFREIRGVTAQGVPEKLVLPTFAPFFQYSVPEFGQVLWERPPAIEFPIHERSPDDFRLATESRADNPALRGASDGRDAGVEIAALADRPHSARFEPSGSDEPDARRPENGFGLPRPRRP